MATKPNIAAGNAPALKTILPGTPEMEQHLAIGYGGMTVEKAETIIKERKANPQAWPYEVYEQAQAFLAAYHASPIAIDTQPGWVREKVLER